MKIISSIKEMSQYCRRAKARGQKISLVPTMGALHEGHLSLVAEARSRGGIVVVSIFVNPIQFGPNEDFKRYPRNLSKDRKYLSPFDPIVLFHPIAEEMYPAGAKVRITGGELEDKLCGQFRPGHFAGVMTVVAKLFNIINPDQAFFGEKDFQQLVIIKKMSKDLNYDTEVIGLPIVREYDGLALSSRNQYLAKDERSAAPQIYRSLCRAKEAFKRGEKQPEKIVSAANDLISNEPLINVEYVRLVDPETLDDLKQVKKGAVLAAAAWIGKTRLIDNLRL